jgi:hypothetical protein
MIIYNLGMEIISHIRWGIKIMHTDRVCIIGFDPLVYVHLEIICIPVA